MADQPRRPSFDLFLSYDPRDAAIVQELARRVSADGFKIWLDAWELVPGATATSEIEQAIRDSLVFAACIGADASDRLEGELAVARRDGSASRILAILLPGGEVPEGVAGGQVVDMRQGVSREAMDSLAQAISAARTALSTSSGTTSPGEGPALNQIDYRQFLEDADRVLEDNPTNTDVLRARVFAFMTLGRHEEALAALDRLAEVAPDDLMLITTRIPLLVSLRRGDEVIAVVRRAEENVDRIVAHIARTFAGKTAAEITSETDALTGLVEMTDRYSAKRLAEAVRTDAGRASRIILGEFAYLAGQALAAAGDMPGAVAEWRRAAASDPDRTWYRLQLVQALNGGGQLDQLDRDLAEWTSDADARVALLAQAWSALRRDRIDDALLHLDDAIALDPLDPVTHAIRADLRVATGRLADSVEDMRAVWENNPSNWQAHSRLLAAYRTLGRLDDEADLLNAWADRAEPFMRGVMRSPGAAPAAGGASWLRNVDRLAASGEFAAQFRARAEAIRIQARLNEGDYTEALRVARRAVSRWPRQYAVWAAAIGLANRLAEAKPNDASAPADEPAWVEPAWQALIAFFANEREAASARMHDLAREASDVGVLHWLSGVMLGDAAVEAGLAPFTRAIEIDPDAPTPLFSRAYVLRRLGRFEEALGDLDVALDDLQAGMEAESYFERGEIRRMLGRHRPAIEDFDRALRIPAREPGLPMLIVGSRGQAKLGLGDADGALVDLNTALEQQPTLVWALISRATAHLLRRDVTSAIGDRRRIVELRPEDPDAWVAYGMMLLETGQHEMLWSALSEAASSHPVLFENLGIRSLLAQSAIATRRFAEAEVHFHASAELQPDEGFWRYEEARAMRHQGRLDDARQLVERTLEQQVIPPAGEPDHLGSRSNRCLYLLATGREKEAEDEWRRLLHAVEDPAPLRTQLEELDALDASGLQAPSLPRIRSSVQARLEELSSAVVG